MSTQLHSTHGINLWIQWIFVLFIIPWSTESTDGANLSETARSKRNMQNEIIPLSRTCTVYDETLANSALTDDATGGICTLLSVNEIRTETSSLSITTKIISAANPLAHYFTIQPQNYSLLTTQRIDREDLCSQTSSEQSASDAMIRCCTSRKRECELQMTVLVQASRKVKLPETNVTDAHTEKQSQFMRLNLRLIDVNDNPPRFPTTRHQVVVSEGIRVGTRLPVPLAQDADSNEYGIFRYYLLSRDDDTFELDQTSPVSTKANSNEKSLLSVDSAYTDTANSKEDLNNYFGTKPYIPESSSTDLAPKQIYLRLVRPLDWEAKQSYKYVIVAEDNGSPALSGQLEVQILVTDENDNHPTFQNKTFKISVPENSPKGTRLIQLVAHDPDQGKAGKVIYSLADQPGVSFNKPLKPQSGSWTNVSPGVLNNTPSLQLFYVDSHSGWLILNGILDYERNKHHLIRVLAKDEAGHPGFDEATVEILVTDVNDVAPAISVDPVTDLLIADSFARQKNVEQAATLNIYLNETPRWTNTETAGLRLTDKSKPLLLAFVAVRDPDTGRGGEFTCSLTNPNSNKENLAQSLGYMYSDSLNANGMHLFPNRLDEHLERTSPSLAGNFRLSPISATQFELSSIAGFDHEKAVVEEIQIVCTDFGQPPLSSRFTVNVHVGDLNDNLPEFPQSNYQLALEENRPADTALQRFTATDMDSGINAEIEYFLDSQGLDNFRIDSKDGTLYTKRTFDREVRQNYHFHVFARDHGSPLALTATATVEVNILDVNDNTPEFVGLDSENCYKFRVPENEPPNTHVGILLGTDNDAKENARLKFRLVTSSGSFKLDATTGELTTIHSLDREKQSQYELIAMLIDYGRPTRSATANIIVYVSDVNDHDPIVVFPANGRGNVTVSFREPPGEVVARIEARDPDEGHNALLHYSLVTGNHNAAFRLGSTSAELIVDRQLIEADIGTYPLDVLIQDAGVPSRSAHVKLTVKVTNSPARIYSNRYSNIQGKLSELEPSSSEDVSPLVESFKRPGAVNIRNAHSTDSRQPDHGTNSENGLVSAGAILVAIVALSCAIILVLLGITVYLCGHKGFGFRRACIHNRTRQSAQCHNQLPSTNNVLSDLVIEPMKRATLTMKSVDSDRTNATPTNYFDPILINPGSATLLRCQFGARASNIVTNNADSPEPKLVRVSSPHSYEAYTTCLPMSERAPISGTYEAIPAGRFLFPITSGTFAGTNGTTVMVNNGEILHPKFSSGPCPPCANKHMTYKTEQTNKTNLQKMNKNSYQNDRQFTQSLKIKRSDWLNACESPVSEGSGTVSSESKHGKLGRLRAAKSWETLAAVSHTNMSEWNGPHKCQTRLHRVIDGFSGNTNNSLTAPKTTEFQSNVSWNPTQETIIRGKTNEQRNVSTFLTEQHNTSRNTSRTQQSSNPYPNMDKSFSLNPFVSPSSLNQGNINQDACGYSQLCRSTKLDQQLRNSPSPSSANQNNFTSNPGRVTVPTALDLCQRRTTKSENLIELMDSSHTSSCSQSCDCALSPVEHNLAVLRTKSTIPSYTEQSEFV